MLYESLYFMAKNRRMAIAAPYVIIIVLLRNIAIGTGVVSGMARLR